MALAAATMREVSIVAVTPALGESTTADPRGAGAAGTNGLAVDAGADLARTLGVPFGPLDPPVAAHDVVLATAPAPGRVDAALALATRRPVVLDGPIATSLEEADRLVRAAAGGLALGYGEPLAHAPCLDPTLAELADLGALAHLEVSSTSGPDDQEGAAERAVTLCLLAAAPSRADSVAVERPGTGTGSGEARRAAGPLRLRAVGAGLVRSFGPGGAGLAGGVGPRRGPPRAAARGAPRA